jgi:hypothetical protein
LLLLIIQFFFPFDGGQSVQGAMLIWPRVVCGSTACRLAHLVVHVFPSLLVTAIWRQHGSPPGFSIQREVEMLCTGWKCGRVTVLPLLSGFSCVSPRFYLRKHAFCFLPLAAILKSLQLLTFHLATLLYSPLVHDVLFLITVDSLKFSTWIMITSENKDSLISYLSFSTLLFLFYSYCTS